MLLIVLPENALDYDNSIHAYAFRSKYKILTTSTKIGGDTDGNFCRMGSFDILSKSLELQVTGSTYQ